MLKIALSGCNGRMGNVVYQIALGRKEMKIVAGFDRDTSKQHDFAVYSDAFEYTGLCDVIIDFSHVDCLSSLLTYCVKNNTPIVICTTGHSPEQIKEIKKASKEIPVFRSGNMSLGINLMVNLLEKCAKTLGENYNIEIIEKHHNQKLDAPSGTAIMLANAISVNLPYDPEYCYDRHSDRIKRPKNQIGIHCIRAGTIVGEHEVVFAGHDEVIKIEHSAMSRGVFASGALDAALFMSRVKKVGMYDMSDVIASK